MKLRNGWYYGPDVGAFEVNSGVVYTLEGEKWPVSEAGWIRCVRRIPTVEERADPPSLWPEIHRLYVKEGVRLVKAQDKECRARASAAFLTGDM